MQQYARKPLVVEAVTVGWENIDDLENLLTAPEGTPDGLQPAIAYMNEVEDVVGDDGEVIKMAPTVTLHDDAVHGEDWDKTKGICVLMPQGDGFNFMLVPPGDYICRNTNTEAVFPLRVADFDSEFEVLPEVSQ